MSFLKDVEDHRTSHCRIHNSTSDRSEDALETIDYRRRSGIIAYASGGLNVSRIAIGGENDLLLVHGTLTERCLEIESGCKLNIEDVFSRCRKGTWRNVFAINRAPCLSSHFLNSVEGFS